MTNNPLLDKYFELYPEKKEQPKPKPEPEEYTEFFLPKDFIEQINNKIPDPVKALTTSIIPTSNTGITKASPIKCFDNNDAFLQIAEKVKNGTVQVSSVFVQVDAIGCFSCGKRITFEVYDYEP